MWCCGSIGSMYSFRGFWVVLFIRVGFGAHCSTHNIHMVMLVYWKKHCLVQLWNSTEGNLLILKDTPPPKLCLNSTVTYIWIWAGWENIILIEFHWYSVHFDGNQTLPWYLNAVLSIPWNNNAVSWIWHVLAKPTEGRCVCFFRKKITINFIFYFTVQVRSWKFV
jgi:hypothetical protein